MCVLYTVQYLYSHSIELLTGLGLNYTNVYYTSVLHTVHMQWNPGPLLAAT